jgi:hypothetical protein
MSACETCWHTLTWDWVVQLGSRDLRDDSIVTLRVSEQQAGDAVGLWQAAVDM